MGEREIAEYQFEQRHNEREAAVCLIRATQDRSPENAVVFVEPVDSRERWPPRRTRGGFPRPQLTTAMRLRKGRRDEDRQQADEFKRYPFLLPSRTMRPPEVLAVFLCSNGVENGVAKEQAETRVFIG